MIAEFCELYPNIHVSLVDCSVENVLKHLQNLDVDLGIGAERDYNDEIEASFLFKLPFFVVMPESHPLVSFETVAWSQLEHEDLITLHGPFTQKLATELPKPLAEQVFKPKYEVNLLSTALGMTSKNLGLTICLPYASDWVRQQGLQMRPLCEPTIERRFFLYRQKDRALSPAGELLSEFIQTHLEKIVF